MVKNIRNCYFLSKNRVLLLEFSLVRRAPRNSALFFFDMKHRTRSYLRALAALSLLAPSVYTVNAADGTWTSTAAGGLWGTPGNWLGGTIADASGFSANFNTVDLSADTTVNLNSARTLTSLTFGDTITSSAGGWILDNGGNAANTLTLAGTLPTITVNPLGAGKAVTVTAGITGNSGLTKAGEGTLEITGDQNKLYTSLIVAAGKLIYSGTTGLGSINHLNVSSTLNVGSKGAAVFNYDSAATSYFSTISIAVSGSPAGVAPYDGTVNQTAGVINVLGSDYTTNGVFTPAMMIGNALNNQKGAYNLSGGTLAVTNTLAVGNRNMVPIPVVFNLSGSGVLSAGTVVVAAANSAGLNGQSSGIVNQTGGTATVNSLILAQGSNADTGSNKRTAVYNLDGGTLTAGSISTTPSTGTGTTSSTFNFAGGTLKANGSTATFMQGLTAANVKAGGAKIDTNGFDVTLGQALLRDSGLSTNDKSDSFTKSGTGDLTLTSNGNTFTGKTTVLAGNLILATGAALASTSIEVAKDAKFTNNTSSALTKTFTLEEGASLVGAFAASASGTTTVTANLSDGNFSTIAFGTFNKNNGTLNLVLSNVTADYSGTVFSGTFGTSSYDKVSVSGTALDKVGSVFSATIAGVTYSYDDSQNSLTITGASAIPEPSTYAALAGLGILGFAVYRRRRQA
jgi:autotransporter-associated beta strand protein